MEATRAAEVLFGCFRTGGAAEPEIFVAGVSAVLSDYPPEVVQRVVDPRTGIPSRVNWIPTIAEVKKACEEEYAPIRRRIERDARLAETQRMLAGPAQPKPTLDELKAKHGDNWGLDAAGLRKPIDEPLPSLEEIKARYEGVEIEASDTLRQSNLEYMQSKFPQDTSHKEG